ncbi:hypothetical protein MNBD_CHLOROFLEXI01-3939 [hydrothermal vent metagenome]|uniref:Uncharacterized protein n=1 Tax=hydrothermal vent metagenome TaxID=652676 RepID=A0A3B0UGV6_9ZZZZ
MEQPISANKDVLDIIIQVLIVVIPVVITWFIRTYVRGTVAEKDIAAIVRLSNTAIDYVENLDMRGDLTLPEDVSKGVHKLNTAGQWLESELRRSGIKITNEEAEEWISAEFQKRVGSVRMVGVIAQLARESVDVINRLEQSRLVSIPPDVDRFTYLTSIAADWIVAQLAKRGATISREEAVVWARAELANGLEEQIGHFPIQERLDQLGKQAVAFLDGLKERGQLAVSGADVETDIVMAWLLTEAARQGLAVTSDQIADTMTIILREHSRN